jgi:hypothetical protein
LDIVSMVDWWWTGLFHMKQWVLLYIPHKNKVHTSPQLAPIRVRVRRNP